MARRLTLFLPLLLLVGACSSGTPRDGAGRRASKEAKAAVEKEAAKEAAAELEEEEPTYTYNPIGKRDPFRPFLSGPREDEIRHPTPLQRWDVDQFQLVGIVWGIDRPRAMVVDPEGESHVLELGTYIGKAWGKVTDITAEAVVVTEEYQTVEGELVTEQVTLTLPVTQVEQ